MGYNTSFSLELHDCDADQTSLIIRGFRNFSHNAAYALDEEGTEQNTCKWYRYKAELTRFSLNYPEVLFLLAGEGEENGDMWKLYVKGGKSFEARATITYPEYDASKLT